MLQVIEAIDGPICLNVCLVSGMQCERSLWCPAHPVWARAQQAMLRVLAEASIADLASRVSQRPALNDLPSEASPLLPIARSLAG
jgi:DNA-binding IscR family transcriptional regulator